MLSLNLAGDTDVKGVASLFKDLFEESVYSKATKYNLEDAQETLRAIQTGGLDNGCILVLKDKEDLVGALACSHMTHLFNKKEKTAVEIGFWVKPSYRSFSAMKKLIGAYKYWAKKTGCSSMLMGKLKTNDTVENYVFRSIK